MNISNRISYKQIKAFVAAAETSSFSRAAEQNFQSQSAFSRCIQELESAIGEHLFLRNNHGVSLTARGKKFLPCAVRLVESYIYAFGNDASAASTLSGKVRLGANNSVSAVLYPQILQRVQIHMPMLSIDFHDCSNSETMDKMNQGKLDYAICATGHDGGDLTVTPLLTAGLGILSSKLFHCNTNIQALHEIRSLPLVKFEDGSNITSILSAKESTLVDFLNLMPTVSSLSSLLALLHTGQVATIVTGIAASHPWAKEFDFVHLPGPAIERHVCLYTNLNTHSQVWHTKILSIINQAAATAAWHTSVRVLFRLENPHT